MELKSSTNSDEGYPIDSEEAPAEEASEKLIVSEEGHRGEGTEEIFLSSEDENCEEIIVGERSHSCSDSSSEGGSRATSSNDESAVTQEKKRQYNYETLLERERKPPGAGHAGPDHTQREEFSHPEAFLLVAGTDRISHEDSCGDSKLPTPQLHSQIHSDTDATAQWKYVLKPTEPKKPHGGASPRYRSCFSMPSINSLNLATSLDDELALDAHLSSRLHSIGSTLSVHHGLGAHPPGRVESGIASCMLAYREHMSNAGGRKEIPPEETDEPFMSNAEDGETEAAHILLQQQQQQQQQQHQQHALCSLCGDTIGEDSCGDADPPERICRSCFLERFPAQKERKKTTCCAVS
eukprot:CAMPEP_0177637954 /NCGR_PEP_ID=MMETSP0447-20121125/5238_1 /TAXON_ID=0 /ORGANISM="Stygamoeba regulata, Strain BSH-02190019" /LENGTH=350 /DNA_ID=CAMNT_0019139899 /DNA_START=200 /DNA_END=1252 /DNA_ORIENTATION=+